MRSRWVVRIFGIAIFLLIVIAGFGQAVLQLWNLLMPDIFGLHPISFWQAVGLMGLSWILFGGLGMFRGRPLYGRTGGIAWQSAWNTCLPKSARGFARGFGGAAGVAKRLAAEPKA